MIAVAIAAVVGPVLAAWAHELTHAAAAWVLGGEVVAVDFLELVVDFRFEPRSPVREWFVLVAPALVGLTVAPVGLLLAGAVDAWTFVGVLSWAVYTLNGGAQGELRLSPVSSEH